MLWSLNPLDAKGNYSATTNDTKFVHWPLMGGLLHLVQRGGAWVGWAPTSPLLAVPNVTAHPSTATASVPITVLLYDGPLLCSFNVAIKGLSCKWNTNRLHCHVQFQRVAIRLRNRRRHCQMHHRGYHPMLSRWPAHRIHHHTRHHHHLTSTSIYFSGWGLKLYAEYFHQFLYHSRLK